jgi:acyl carrier protein
LTAQRFMADPYGDSGARMYRTGDLARWTEDGQLEFLGRVDEQIKLRGFRVEPGEIEALMRQHPDVGEAVVVAREDEPGAKRLVAYVVPVDGSAPAETELRALLTSTLPAYMIPSAFVVLETLPLSPNGKLDRQALPQPVAPHARTDYVPPGTDTERTLTEIWADVLDLDQIGIHDNFFELGGDSIRSLLIVSKTKAAFDVDLTPRDVLTAYDVCELAKLVEEKILLELERVAFGDGNGDREE